MDTNNENHPAAKPANKRGRAKRILGYTGLALAVIIGAGGGVGLYEYHHLQPKNYITAKTRPVLAVGSKQQTQQQQSPQVNGTFNVSVK